MIFLEVIKMEKLTKSAKGQSETQQKPTVDELKKEALFLIQNMSDEALTLALAAFYEGGKNT